MGCMGSHDHENMSRNRDSECIPLSDKHIKSPQQLSNGNTFIPIHYITCQYSTIYPQWLLNDISPSQYSVVISKLNHFVSLSPMNSDKDTPKKSLFSSRSKRNAQMKQFVDELHLLLLQINASILNPLGINAISTWKEADTLSSQIGLIIERIHIHCTLTPNTCSSIESEEGHLVIFPIYEYENTESDDEDYYSDSYN